MELVQELSSFIHHLHIHNSLLRGILDYQQYIMYSYRPTHIVLDLIDLYAVSAQHQKENLIIILNNAQLVDRGSKG